MRRSVTAAGLLLLLLPLLARAANGAASSASSAPATLYDRIKNEVDNELTQKAVEPEVRAFVRSVINKQYNLQLSDSDIDTLAQGQRTQTCGNVEQCQSVMQDVELLVDDEERVRSLGRDLQLTATSNELPVANLPGRSLQLSRDMQGIVNIWSADNYRSSSSASSVSSSSAGSVASASSSATQPLRTVEVDPGDNIVNRQTMQPLLEQLGNALNDLSSEQRIAAVWHYQYGVRLVQGARQPDYPPPYVDDKSGDGTERQYLFKKQAAVEQALLAIWTVIVNDTFNPPLQQNETALYEFPTDLMKETLPDNVIVWARMDLAGKNKNHPLGDVGLQWTTPLEPVLPSLTSVTDNSPILGGNYPPEPVIPGAGSTSSQPLDGRGLCSDPTQNQGYLCRRYIVTGGADPCPGSASSGASSSADPTAITLVTCPLPSPYPPTIAGPDVCRDLSYQTPKPFDPNTQCNVQIDCVSGTSCPGLPEGYAETFPKDSKGVIRICIPEQSAADYVLFHELHHAYQVCNLPPNPNATNPNFKGYLGIPGNTNTLCCEMEGEAYRAECNLMEQDGEFKNVPPIDGIPVNAETCAEALTDVECSSRGIGHCPVSRTYTQKFIDAASGKNNDITLRPNPVAAGYCSKISTVVNGQKEYKDPRVQALIDKIQGMNPVSMPGTTANFTNRIGNEMCYIGQAVEESAEQKRITGARTPATTGDQSFPFHSPLTGKPLGNQLVDPPIDSTPLPLYRPQLVMENLDAALCQIDGMPPETPPILCAIQSDQTYQFPLTDPTAMMQNLFRNLQNEKTANENLLDLAPAFGARLGTDLYSDYLRSASRSLAGVLGMAVKLFRDMTSLNFPTQMCPLDGSQPGSSAASSPASSPAS